MNHRRTQRRLQFIYTKVEVTLCLTVLAIRVRLVQQTKIKQHLINRYAAPLRQAGI